MAENKRKTKSAILGELESIKDLLQDREDALPNNECDEPPILTDEIKTSITPQNMPESPQTTLPSPPKQTASSPWPNTPLAAQRSLFPAFTAGKDNPPGESAKHQAQKAQTPITMIENPFLPKHIRDRLHTDKSLIDEIKDSPPFAGVVQPSYAPSTLIDELIGEFMPKIETELRRRLENLIQPPLISPYQACDPRGEEGESPTPTQPFSPKD